MTSDMVHLLCKDVAMLMTGRPATLGLALLGRINLICWALLRQAFLAYVQSSPVPEPPSCKRISQSVDSSTPSNDGTSINGTSIDPPIDTLAAPWLPPLFLTHRLSISTPPLKRTLFATLSLDKTNTMAALVSVSRHSS